MYSENFDYYRPSSLEETIELLQKHDGARILAGGHSLLPAMKLRLTAAPALIDIGRIDSLRGIQSENGAIHIGAMTTHAEIAESPVVQSDCPILSKTASNIGDAQVRNRGTIGGSLAHGDPGADFPTVLLALSARIQATGPGGERTIGSSEFCTDMFTTALEPAEVLTSVTVPRLGKGVAGVYLKHHHPASRYAVVGVAVVVKLDGGKIDKVQLAVGGVSAYPVRCTNVETALVGKEPTAEALHEAAGRVSEAVRKPIGDFYASVDFRLHLAQVMAERALKQAVEQAR